MSNNKSSGVLIGNSNSFKTQFRQKSINKNMSNFKIIGNMLEFNFRELKIRRIIKNDAGGKYINFRNLKIYVNEIVK